MVGRLEGPKGFAHGLMAAAKIKQHLPDIRVDVVGLGEELITLQGLAEGLGIAGAVTFHGRLDRSRTHHVMAAATVVLVPSLIIEGFSLVAAETAFLGRPVVAYRVGGLTETIIDQHTGALVPAGNVDALAESTHRYLTDQTLRATHGQNARANARSTFGVERYAQDLGEYYRTVLNQET